MYILTWYYRFLYYCLSLALVYNLFGRQTSSSFGVVDFVKRIRVVRLSHRQTDNRQADRQTGSRQTESRGTAVF